MEKAGAVRDMFDRIAVRYDRANSVMTFGLDAAWRARAARELAAPADDTIVDLACGTGPLTATIAHMLPRAHVVGVDFSERMLEVARARRSSANVEYVRADVLALPFPDASFDGATMGFSLRNIVDLGAGLREIARVLKAGRRFANLEISQPQSPMWRACFSTYFQRVVPAIGGMVGGDRPAYRYLPQSLVNFPRPPALTALFEANGFCNTRCIQLFGGGVAIHVGEKRA